MAKLLDHFEKEQRGEVPAAPIAKLLGLRLAHVKPGEAAVEFQVTQQHVNHLGALHGGTLCDLADAAMGVAYASILEEDETLATLELKVNFLRPVWNGKLTATGTVVSNGKAVGLVECTIIDEKQRPVARASSTCMKVRGEKAQGRSGIKYD